MTINERLKAMTGELKAKQNAIKIEIDVLRAGYEEIARLRQQLELILVDEQEKERNEKRKK